MRIAIMPAALPKPRMHTDMLITALLAFSAGSVDAFGLQFLGHFSSHMSGTTSTTISAVMSGGSGFGLGLCVLVAFVTGAACSSFIVNSLGTRGLRQAAVFVLALEIAAIVMAFVAITASHFLSNEYLPLTFLAFGMGAQNNLSKRVFGSRTTHVTGTLTDIGSAIGYRMRKLLPLASPLQLAPKSLQKPLILFVCFVMGGACGWEGAYLLDSWGLAVPAISMLVTVVVVSLLMNTLSRPEQHSTDRMDPTVT